jgi:hypothetical protein
MKNSVSRNGETVLMYPFMLQIVIRYHHNILFPVSKPDVSEAIFLTPGQSFFGMDVLHEVAATYEAV